MFTFKNRRAKETPLRNRLDVHYTAIARARAIRLATQEAIEEHSDSGLVVISNPCYCTGNTCTLSCGC